MNERWPRVKALFEAAVERPAEERDAFLAAEAGDDYAVRRGVESLLASDECASVVTRRRCSKAQGGEQPRAAGIGTYQLADRRGRD